MFIDIAYALSHDSIQLLTNQIDEKMILTLYSYAVDQLRRDFNRKYKSITNTTNKFITVYRQEKDLQKKNEIK